MEHFDQESQKIDSVLNYYQVSFRRTQNTLHLRDFKNFYKIEKFPILKVQQSLFPEKLICGY